MKKLRILTFVVLALFSTTFASTSALAFQLSPIFDEVLAVNESEEEPDFQAIVTHTDVPVTFTNDETNPWAVEGNTAIIRGKDQVNYNAESLLTMTFTLSQHGELCFDWAFYDYGYHERLSVFIDGVEKDYTSYSSSNYTTKHFYLEPGEHVVVFRDYNGYRYYSRSWSGVKNVKVREIQPLENVVLTGKSQPLTFTNESATLWTTEDGYIEHCNYRVMNLGSKFSTTFDVEKTSKLSFTYKVANFNTTSYNNEECHNLFVKINGIQISKSWNNQSDTYWCVALEPGHYTVSVHSTV